MNMDGKEAMKGYKYAAVMRVWKKVLGTNGTNYFDFVPYFVPSKKACLPALMIVLGQTGQRKPVWFENTGLGRLRPKSTYLNPCFNLPKESLSRLSQKRLQSSYTKV